MRAALLLLLALVAIPAHAQVALGDVISLDGVEVRGLRTRRAADEVLPRRQRRGGARIALREGGRVRGGTTVQVCGQDATRIEEHTQHVPSQHVVIRPDVPSAHLYTPDRPATTTVRIVLERGGHRITVEWSVATERREQLRSLEEAFFASIRCR